MKYREIERTTGVSHNTVILWVKQKSEASSSLESVEEEDNST